MRTWIRPSAIEENFASNQNIASDSVSACYSLYCLVAGDGEGNWTGNNFFNGSSFNWGNESVTPDGGEHGKPCACGASYDKNSGKFYEYGKQVSTTKPDISNISKIFVDGKTGYQATWKSTDGVRNYQHFGYAINDKPDRPNHS